MTESSYDVYVHEGHIVEVHRGEQGTVAQVFGEDWTAAPMVHLHPPAFAPKKVAFSELAVRYYDLRIAIAFVALVLFGSWLVLR